MLARAVFFNLEASGERTMADMAYRLAPLAGIAIAIVAFVILLGVSAIAADTHHVRAISPGAASAPI